MRMHVQTKPLSRRPEANAGFATVGALFSLTLMAAFLGSMVLVSHRSANEERANVQRMKAQYLADTGVHEAVADVRRGGKGLLGSERQPVTLGEGDYYVERADLTGELMSLIATARVGSETVITEIILRSPQQTPTNPFDFGVFGDSGVSLKSDVEVDSYDSRLGTYRGQSKHDESLVRSNQEVKLESGSKIMGDAMAGPGYSVRNHEGRITGTTSSARSAMTLPDIVVPPGIETNFPKVKENQTASFPPGDYVFKRIHLNSNRHIAITGPANVIVDSLQLGSSCTVFADSTAGPVHFYCTGSVSVGSDAGFYSSSNAPVDLQIHISDTPSHGNVVFGSGVTVYGMIHGHERGVTFGSDAVVYGGVAAENILFGSGCFMHQDLALMDLTGGSGPNTGNQRPEVVSWRRLSVAEKAALQNGTHRNDMRGQLGSGQ